MSADAPLDIVEINPIYLVRREDPQRAQVLLHPEGFVKLSETAGEMLGLCTGD